MKTDALTFLLRARDSRQASDHFPRNMFLFGSVLWLLLLMLVFFINHTPEVSVAVGMGIGILSPVTLLLAVSLPLRQVQKDASLHATFFGGRCYDEILGTLMKPGEILDQIATHSVRACLFQSAPWAALTAFLWIVLAPAEFPQILLIAGLWFPCSALFVWTTSYLAQQFAIYNSQLKVGLMTSVGDSLIGAFTGIPVAVSLMVSILALADGQVGLACVCLVGYLLLTTVASRWVATTGIEKLPHMRQKFQELSRKWLGTRRNRFVPAWSDNAIVVRERTRDSARIPGQLLGALIFQLPLASAILGAGWLAKDWTLSGSSRQELFYGLLGICGCLQMLLASRRCSTAIVGEIESKTLETMQNTRLHARQFLAGWLEVGAFPRILENLLILIVLCLFCGETLSYSMVVQCSLVFLFAPVLGSAVGLAASCASNRDKAGRAYSEKLSTAVFGWLMTVLVVSWIAPWLLSVWPTLMLLYAVTVFGLHMRSLLRKIEVV